MSVEFVTRSKLCERLEATKTPSGWTWNSIDQTGRRHDLPSPADASAFWSTVEKAEETGRRLDAGERQTFSALITEFKNSAAFRLKGTAATVITEPQDEAKPRSKRRGIQKSTQGLAKSTRDQYARYMRLIEQAWGSDPVRALTTRDAQKAIDAFVDDDEPAAGRAFCATLSRLIDWGIFRDRGPAWRRANAGHVSLDQLKVMSAIENCRTAALGGHVARCEDCAYTTIAYNSCRNRHCPKCQGAAAKGWLIAREADLLPVPYYHVVFTLPAAIADIAYQNNAVIYDLLFKASAETMLTIAADPKHLGARIGITSVLHTWGSALTHHPHVHMIVPGGGVSLDGKSWISCRPGFFLPVRVLSRLFRRLFLEKLIVAHKAGHLKFFGNHAALADAHQRKAFLAAVRLSIEPYDSWEHRYSFTFIATRISACAGTEHHEFALFIWLSICL